MKVPLLDLPAQHRTIRQELMAAVEGVFESQQFILGGEVEQFEKAIADYCGVKHAIGCSSGSDALLLALIALGIKPGDEVITSTFSFFATASAIARLGACPVLVDIRSDDFNLDPALIERAITPRTKVVMPVHLFGQCADMDAVRQVAAHFKLAVIEDAAQAIGAEYHGQRAGTMGEVGCFSFFPTKNLGGAGDGGLLTTDHEDFAERLSLLRVHGMQPKYHHQVIGINGRLDALQAAVLKVKLRHLDGWTTARRNNAKRYGYLFAEAAIGQVTTPVVHPDRQHIYHQYTIRCERRNELKDYLAARGVGTEVYYPIPLHLQECFAYLGYRRGDLPHSEQAAREVLSLPVYPELTAEMQQYVVGQIADFYRS